MRILDACILVYSQYTGQLLVSPQLFVYTMKKIPPFRRTFAMRPLAEAVLTFLESRGGSAHVKLNALWENWAAVMGNSIASLGMPLGQKEQTLIIGAEDTMAMQDLTMMSFEIVERANAFLDERRFTKVKVSLLQKSKPLNYKEKSSTQITAFQKVIPPPPPGFGSLKGTLDPESPVAKCYEAFLRLYFP